MIKHRLFPLLISFCLLLSVAGCSKSSDGDNTAPAAVVVEVTFVERGEITSDSRLSGTVVAARDVTVNAPVAAKVLDIFVKNGDVVEEDQVLFSLDREDLEKQYRTLLENYYNTKELLSSQVASARQSVEDTKTLMAEQLRLAEENAHNTQALFEIGAASRLERDTAANAYTQAKINAESAIRQAELGYLQAQTNYDSTMSSLEDSKEDLEELLDDADVKAPIAGVVSALSVTKGAVLAPQVPACVVSEIGKNEIAVSVSETAHRFLKVGDAADVVIGALSSDSFPATILSISPAPNAISQLYDVRLALPSGVDAGIGMFADVVFHLEKHENAVLVPTEAILTEDDSQFVFTAEEGTAKKIMVTTGLTGSGVTEILSGLDGGEPLVVKGQSYLKDGDPVRIVDREEQGA